MGGGGANWNPSSHRTDAPATEFLTDTSEHAAARHLQLSQHRFHPSASSAKPHHLVSTVHAHLFRLLSNYNPNRTTSHGVYGAAWGQPLSLGPGSMLHRAAHPSPRVQLGPTTRPALNPAAMMVVLNAHYVTFFSSQPRGFSLQ